jgi:hypothetical protein
MMAAARFFDLAKYLIANLSNPLGNPVMVSQLLLDDLVNYPELYELVVGTLHYLCVGEEGLTYSMNFVQDSYQMMRDNGVRVQEPSPELRAAYDAAVAPVTEQFFRDYPFMVSVYEELVALRDQFRSQNR